MQYQRSPDSPPDFDQRLKQEQLVCDQYKKLDAQMPDSVEPPFKPLEELGFTQVKADTRYVMAPIDIANSDAVRYEHDRVKCAALSAKSRSSDLENTYIAIGPLLLAIAVALRVTKTSGEISNAKKRSRIQ